MQGRGHARQIKIAEFIRQECNVRPLLELDAAAVLRDPDRGPSAGNEEPSAGIDGRVFRRAAAGDDEGPPCEEQRVGKRFSGFDRSGPVRQDEPVGGVFRSDSQAQGIVRKDESAGCVMPCGRSSDGNGHDLRSFRIHHGDRPVEPRRAVGQSVCSGIEVPVYRDRIDRRTLYDGKIVHECRLAGGNARQVEVQDVRPVGEDMGSALEGHASRELSRRRPGPCEREIAAAADRDISYDASVDIHPAAGIDRGIVRHAAFGDQHVAVRAVE